MTFLAAMLLGVGALGAGGCRTSAAPATRPTAQAAEAPKPLAYVAGEPVWDRQILPPLLEADGGQVLAELALDRLIAQRLARQGLTVGPPQLEAERELILQSLSDDPDQAARLLRQLRQQRGLGDQRFEALLRRNAGLRLLVQDQVQITPMALQQAFDLAYGPRYHARLILVDQPQQAAQLRQQILDGASFIDLAVTHSTDASAAQGGLLPPISPADPAYPQVVREALARLDREGRRLSDIIALDNGYALLMLERKIDAQPVAFDDVKEELTAQARLRQERLQMQQLARRLLNEAKVVVLDPALSESWRQQRELLLAP